MRITSTSSFIESFSHDPEHMILSIKLRKGSVLRYAGVSADVFDEMRGAESHGKFYNSEIKGTYEQI